ncbi:MAG: PLD nuclease N-terminal domain-containing protein [Spirochaetia bacterium]
MDTQNLILAGIPILIINVILIIICLKDWLNRENYAYLPKWGWLTVIILINVIGPVLYLVLGRRDS